MTCVEMIALTALAIAQAPEVKGRSLVATTVMVTGDVRFAAPGCQPRGLFVSAKLAANDHITVHPGGEAVVIFYATGRRERLKPVTDGQVSTASTVVVGRDGCEPKKGVDTLKPLDVRIIDNLDKIRPLIESGSAGVFIPRSDSGRDEADLPEITPATDSVVLTDRPSFSWPRYGRASHYRVQVLDAAGQPVWTSQTDATRLPYPEHEKALALSQRYTLEVVALFDGAGEVPVVGGSPFQTVARGLFPTLKAIHDLSRGSDPSDLVLAAQMFLHYDVYGEAMPLFERLKKVMPNDPGVHAGLAVCYHRLGKEALACAARCRAEELFARSEALDDRP